MAGGTGRVGGAIAARLEADGWSVFAAGRRDGDLRTAAGARTLVAAALAGLGGLDLLVHAAADAFAPTPFDRVTEADWEAAMDVTAKGTFFLAQAAADALRESRGAIVIVEDVADAVAYLARASFVTGTSLVVDGGTSLKSGGGAVP